MKSLQTDVLPNQPSPNSLDNSNNSQNNFSGQQPVANNPTDPIKRYFSNCGASGFEVAYMLSNPAAISGQGYYEVTDNGNETGNYQPNLELSATLLMNAANMLEPYFEVQHDDSGQLKVLSPGEVLRQGRTWQIVEKCKIAY